GTRSFRSRFPRSFNHRDRQVRGDLAPAPGRGAMSLFPRPSRIVSESKARPPQVSVIITLYNYAGYVEECLDSIAAQTASDLEIIVVDDCSTDDGLKVTSRWLERNADRFAAHALIAHMTNMGLSYARNTAFLHASAERV